jgi:hypothetical protein
VNYSRSREVVIPGSEDACRLRQRGNNRRSARATELPANVDLGPIVVGLVVCLELTVDGELRLVDYHVDRERSAALALAMVAVAHHRREKVTGDLVADGTAKTTSCLHGAYGSSAARCPERRYCSWPG